MVIKTVLPVTVRAVYDRNPALLKELPFQIAPSFGFWYLAIYDL